MRSPEWCASAPFWVAEIFAIDGAISCITPFSQGNGNTMERYRAEVQTPAMLQCEYPVWQGEAFVLPINKAMKQGCDIQTVIIVECKASSKISIPNNSP